ncbi:hypothetical protein PsYK624_151610 [Phanerochaete sordida]|uniref:Uncharacterized protein n=1 Tax=Phanerochaete sordida TaxID=48140 RepID=A0A9P3GRB5_9APHY|nr:hypothetical protein PsYK624_151610 [Phanerochaete sordida]
MPSDPAALSSTYGVNLPPGWANCEDGGHADETAIQGPMGQSPAFRQRMGSLLPFTQAALMMPMPEASRRHLVISRRP